MVDAGYVERQLDTTDQRAKWLNLTSRGQAALAAAREIHHASELKLASELGVEPLITLREVLEHLVTPDGPRLLRLP